MNEHQKVSCFNRRKTSAPFFKSTDVTLLSGLVCFLDKNGRLSVMIGQITCQSNSMQRVSSMNTQWPFVRTYPKSKEEFCALVYTVNNCSKIYSNLLEMLVTSKTVHLQKYCKHTENLYAVK